MKMNLKNYSNKYKKRLSLKQIKISTKNFYIFLISFTIISIVIGILFYFFINSSDKITITDTLNNNFSIKDSYNYIDILKEKIFKNSYNIFVIWILGLSIIGLFAVIFIYFMELFSIGFTISAIVDAYKLKGIIGILIYLFPSKILYLIAIFILTLFSIKMSYKLYRLCFSKEDINIKKEVKKYFKILIFVFIFMLFISLIETFIDPVFINIFNKI